MISLRILSVALVVIVLATLPGYGKKEADQQARTDYTASFPVVAEKSQPGVQDPPTESGVRQAVARFWKCIQYNDWKGLLELYSKAGLEGYYSTTIKTLEPVLRFSRSEIVRHNQTLSDPDQIRTGKLALYYKDGDIANFRYWCGRTLAEGILSNFDGLTFKSYTIDEITLAGQAATVRLTYKVVGKSSGKEYTESITQRYFYRDKKWVFD